MRTERAPGLPQLKILILKPSSLGDVVQALPVLRLLKRHWPHSAVHWWVDSALAPLLEGDPDLARVVPFDRHRWAYPAHWPEVARSIFRMRNERYDLVIDLQCLARSGAVAWLANGNFLIGLDEPREGARGFYDRVIQRPSYETHAVDWYLEVLAALGVPVNWNFDWLPARPKVAADLERKWQVRSSRWVALQPGARWPNKRWPIDHYTELVRRLAAAHPDIKFAVLGNSEDRVLGAAIASVAPRRCVDLTSQTSLPEMVEWIRLSELMISNDSGPMHVAAALNRPITALFGPTNPRRTGPYGQLANVLQTRLPCVPCMKARCSYVKPLECLWSISPTAVFERADQALKARGSGSFPDTEPRG